METKRIAIVLGTAVGAVVSVAAWVSEQRMLAAGESPASIGFGLSHGLFLVGFPWSIVVWAAMIGAGSSFNLNGTEFARPFFYAMPIVAGSGWGFVVAVVLNRRRRRRTLRGEREEPSPG